MPVATLTRSLQLAGCRFQAASLCPAQSNVYSLAIYAGGTSYASICELQLPQRFELPATCWQENTNGYTIMDFRKRAEPGVVSRQCLEVQYGDEKFTMPWDALP